MPEEYGDGIYRTPKKWRESTGEGHSETPSDWYENGPYGVGMGDSSKNKKGESEGNTKWQDRVGHPSGHGSKKPNNKSGSKGILSIVVGLVWAYSMTYGHSAVAKTVDYTLSGGNWEGLRFFTLDLLQLFAKVFFPISTLAIIIIAFIAFGRGLLGFIGVMFRGTMSVAIAGLLIFFATFFYLLLIGVIG